MSIKAPSTYVKFGEIPDWVYAKYWGRVPKYVHKISETLFDPDTAILQCNEEYIWLITEYILGNLNEENISQELLYELREGISLIPDYGTIPMPEWDPLFYCIFGPKDPTKQCEMLADNNC
jgi:hypothetical protein